MKKSNKVISAALASTLAASMLAGCGSSSSSSSSTADSSSTQSAETATTEAAASEESSASTEAASGDAVEFSFFGAIWDPYTETSDILDAWQSAANCKIDFEWVQEDSYDTQLAAKVASQDLPDVIKKEDGNVDDLIEQGLILPLDDYLEEYCPNYLAQLTEDDLASLRNPSDGKIYGLSLIVDNEAAYSTMIRSDWLTNLGLEEPQTWDDWVNVWTAFRDNDANGDGDATNEIPLAVSYDQFYMLENMFGIESNGYFSIVDGKYVYDPENPNYETFLDNMRELYADGILYSEFITCDQEQLNTIGSNNTLGSTVNWAEQAKNYSLACQELGNTDALYSCVTPITGPNGDQKIQARTKLSENTFITINAQDRLPQILQAFDYLYSDEGIILTNYGIEGETFEYDEDGNPVVLAPYNTDFSTARSYDLIPSIIPFVFLHDSYMQYLMGGKTEDELDAAGQSFIDGLTINDDYYYQAPKLYTTDAWVEHSDLVEQQIALRDNYIMGKISKDEYNTQYQELKDAGLQDVIDQAQAAYESVSAQ